jgi:hypothetical protein
MRLPATPAADPRRAMPEGTASRRDAIEIALASLAREERRLRQLGFQAPLARCRQQRRYWEFLRAVFAVSDDARSGRVAVRPR